MTDQSVKLRDVPTGARCMLLEPIGDEIRQWHWVRADHAVPDAYPNNVAVVHVGTYQGSPEPPLDPLEPRWRYARECLNPSSAHGDTPVYLTEVAP